CVCLQRCPPIGVDKLGYAAGSCLPPLRRRQLFAYEQTLRFGSRDNAVGAIGDYRVPTCGQFVCCDEPSEGVLIGCPTDDVAALAVDLYGHKDADQKLADEGHHEQVGHLRLTCFERPRYRFRNDRVWQGVAEGRLGIDELPHVRVDEHDVAAWRKAQRGLGLTLELSEVALAQRQRGGQRL